MYSADKHSHTISLNDFIATAKVIQAVKERFSLTGEVKIEKNNSGEFDSLWFDREE